MDTPVLTTVKEVRDLVKRFKSNNESLGFVPTMGFLHEGHRSLISRSLSENKHTIISIFVNPAQFAPGEDLDSYPRDIEHDLKEISKLDGKIDAIFKPSVDEMYPMGIPLTVGDQIGAFVEIKGLSEVLEGKTRPNFFRGVATVVSKLFNIVQPNNVYFGQKDIQQTVIIKRLISDLFFDLNMHIVPIKRNDDGLALSSRNKYLSPEILDQVTCIFRGLKLARDEYKNQSQFNVDILTSLIEEAITSTNSKFKIDYISFNDAESLRYLETINPKVGAIISLAVYVPNSTDSSESGTTRLIDNMIL